jgi:hypothetical protein
MLSREYIGHVACHSGVHLLKDHRMGLLLIVYCCTLIEWAKILVKWVIGVTLRKYPLTLVALSENPLSLSLYLSLS